MAQNAGLQPTLTKWPTNKLALAQLAPETATAAAFVAGVVSLLWPFSPSNATLSLLVCEEGFRLRGNRCQLRVVHTVAFWSSYTREDRHPRPCPP